MVVRVFKDLEFEDWARSEGITDSMLCVAAAEIESGLVDARLGGFLLKKRVAAPARGKRGGYRMLVAHRQGDRLIFLHGFGKNEKENVSSKEKEGLHKLGDIYMQHSDATLAKLIEEDLILEVEHQ